MPTDYEYALFSEQVFHDKGGEVPAPWNIIATQSDSKKRFFAAVYQNNTDIVFAFQGRDTQTDPKKNIEEIIEDYQHFNQNFPKVKNFITNTLAHHNQNNVYRVSFTGFSVGALYAEKSACVYKLKAVTFESLGSKSFIENDPTCQGYQSKNIVTYLAAPNLFNTLGEQVAGKLKRIYVNHVDSIRPSHVMKCILSSGARVTTYCSAFYFVSAAFGMGSTAAATTTTTTAATSSSTAAAGLEFTKHQVLNEVLKKAKHFHRMKTAAAAATATQTAELVSLGGASVSAFTTSKLNMQAVNTAEWTLKQHNIENIVQQFSSTTGKPLKYMVIQSWPKLQEKKFFSTDTLKEMGTDLLPLRPYNRGIHNIISENQMIETQIENMPGYQVSAPTKKRRIEDVEDSDEAPAPPKKKVKFKKGSSHKSPFFTEKSQSRVEIDFSDQSENEAEQDFINRALRGAT